MSNTSEVSNHSDEISNSELVRKSQLGDKAAFEQLVIRHQDLVFSLAYKLTGNREMANDVAQVCHFSISCKFISKRKN